MSNSVNKIILVGHLGSDPELRSIPSGKTVARFSVATSNTWKGRDGQRQEKTEWHRIVAWERLGQFAGEYLQKGRLVYVEGSIEYRSWDDKDGQKRYITEIKARDIQMLGPRPDRDGGGGGGGGSYGGGGGGGSYGGGAGSGGGGGRDNQPPAPDLPDDDDVPF